MTLTLARGGVHECRPDAASQVLVWDGEQLGAWLEALGLGDLAPSFLHHNVNGGTVFLLTEEHLRDLGFSVVGDRLYFIELLTQLCGIAETPRHGPRRAGDEMSEPASPRDGGAHGTGTTTSSRGRARSACSSRRTRCRRFGRSASRCSRRRGASRTCARCSRLWGSRRAPPARTSATPPPKPSHRPSHPTAQATPSPRHPRHAAAAQEYVELFVEHRIQGDVLFNLTEENLKEMGIEKIGDRLLITDIVQTLYEQVTGWQQQQVNPQSLLQLGAA